MLRLKIDPVSYPARAEGSGKYDKALSSSICELKLVENHIVPPSPKLVTKPKLKNPYLLDNIQQNMWHYAFSRGISKRGNVYSLLYDYELGSHTAFSTTIAVTLRVALYSRLNQFCSENLLHSPAQILLSIHRKIKVAQRNPPL